MKKTILTFIFICVSLSMISCEKPEPVHAIDWYKDHEKERNEMIEKCKNNPGELEFTPNCINAKRADSAIDAAKSGGLNVKPITEEEWEQIFKKNNKPQQ